MPLHRGSSGQTCRTGRRRGRRIRLCSNLADTSPLTSAPLYVFSRLDASLFSALGHPFLGFRDFQLQDFLPISTEEFSGRSAAAGMQFPNSGVIALLQDLGPSLL